VPQRRWQNDSDSPTWAASRRYVAGTPPSEEMKTRVSAVLSKEKLGQKTEEQS